jgi:hypothetical protein
MRCSKQETIPCAVVVKTIKKNLGSHWALHTVTSAKLSAWLQIPTDDAKDLLERLCLHKKAARAGRESSKNRIEWNGTTCIQYTLLKEEQSDIDFPVGAWVKHAEFGDGEVIFSKPGFPSVKALFNGVEHRISKAELTS